MTRGRTLSFACGECSAKVIQVPGAIRKHADVAQLVAHNLAKVGVASSSLVIRSSEVVSFRGGCGTWDQFTRGGVAERLGTGLQSRLHGFESRRHLTAQLNSLYGRDWRSGSALP